MADFVNVPHVLKSHTFSICWVERFLHLSACAACLADLFMFVRDVLNLQTKSWSYPYFSIAFPVVMYFCCLVSNHVRFFETPWIAAHQASLSFTVSWSLLKLTSIESVMLGSQLSLCRPLLCLPPIPPSIRVFSNESALHIRWPKYWSFSISISPSNEYSGLISFR